MLITVINCGQLGGHHFIAAFLSHLSNGSQTWGLANIGPSTGESPTSVFTLPDEEHSAGIESGGSHINLRCGVPGVALEHIYETESIQRAAARGHHLCCNAANGRVAFSVKNVFGI
jgi:hypothetical protein